MSEPPDDAFEFWLRFFCALVVFGIILALATLRFADAMGWGIYFLLVSGGAVMLSMAAAFRGDGVWEKFFSFFFWWR